MTVRQYERRLDNVKNFEACAGEKRIIMNDRDWEYKLKRSNNSGNNLLCLPHLNLKMPLYTITKNFHGNYH